MTVVAHFPEGADTTGVNNAAPALQTWLNTIPIAGLGICPDGIYRVDTGLVSKVVCHLRFSRGAVLIGKTAIGTAPILRIQYNAPSGGQQNVQQEGALLSGGNFVRESRNGPCVKVEAFRGGKVQNVVCRRGSPHIFIASTGGLDNGVPGWLYGTSGSNYTAACAVYGCRGFDGGPEGLRFGHDRAWNPSTTVGDIGETNRIMAIGNYFEGDGSSGSTGLTLGTTAMACYLDNTFVNYHYHQMNRHRSGSSICSNCSIGHTIDYHYPTMSGVARANVVDEPTAVFGGGVYGPNEVGNYSNFGPTGTWTR